MAHVINSSRPWFLAKLTKYTTDLASLVTGAIQTGSWTAWTGTAARGTVATYTAADISASPTEAEVQAIANAAQANSRAIKALIDDLKAAGILG